MHFDLRKKSSKLFSFNSLINISYTFTVPLTPQLVKWQFILGNILSTFNTHPFHSHRSAKSDLSSQTATTAERSGEERSRDISISVGKEIRVKISEIILKSHIIKFDGECHCTPSWWTHKCVNLIFMHFIIIGINCPPERSKVCRKVTRPSIYITWTVDKSWWWIDVISGWSGP